MSSLPNGDSPELHLVHPTPAELTQIWSLYAPLWGKVLPLPEFLEECRHMFNAPLFKDGGLTPWVLVSKDEAPDNRAILSCCRTLRKRALVSDVEGNVDEGIVHAVSAVFCDPRLRGKGYASRMMAELGKKLRTWQVNEGKERCFGSALYSDIGTKFYRDIGWIPASHNTHFEFPAKLHPKPPGITALHAQDLEALCMADEILMRQQLAKPSEKTRLAIVADHEHMLWHHAKEEFVFEKIYGRKPELKGVLAGGRGKRVWAIWTHRLYCPPGSLDASRNTLYILRLVIEHEYDATSSEDQMEIKACLEAVIQSAQNEAAEWDLSTAKLWNPSPLVEKLIEWTGIRCDKVERDRDSIASLLWYGDESQDGVEWIANEKYAWC